MTRESAKICVIEIKETDTKVYDDMKTMKRRMWRIKRTVERIND